LVTEAVSSGRVKRVGIDANARSAQFGVVSPAHRGSFEPLSRAWASCSFRTSKTIALSVPETKSHMADWLGVVPYR